MKRLLIILFFAALVFVGGVVVGLYIPINPPSMSADVYESNPKYHFINPILYCSDQNISNTLVQSLQSTVQDYITAEQSSGDITDAAVYFRDLNGGPWMLINGDLQSVPASLLKVPTAISIFRHAEENPGFLNTAVTYTSPVDVNANQYFKPAQTIASGKSYTLEQLVEYMLADSDNGALDLLSTQLSQEEFQNTYSDLGVSVPTATSSGYTISVKTYGSFFRILFYASYLSRDSSEQLLSILSQSNFSNGLRAGVPSNIVIAHKFGEFRSSPTSAQLNDCGIIYKPNQPYLLCVMTHGANYDTLATVIAHISKTVYDSLAQ